MKHFLNDGDGMSSKDYLLVISSFIFFFFISVALIMLLFGVPIDTTYLELLDTVKPVVITITSGVFGVKAVETFTNKREPKEEEKQKKVEEDIDYEGRV